MYGLFVGLLISIGVAFSDFDIRPRTGDYFLSTRTPFAESFGMRLYGVGYEWAPTVVAPLVLCPAGFVLAGADKFVLSPVWDVLCLPYDAMIDREKPEGRRPPDAERGGDEERRSPLQRERKGVIR